MAEPTGELQLDAVAATVDGKPITLSDIATRMALPNLITMQDAAVDPKARQALDQLIHERLIVAEAATQELTASEQEIEDYLTAVRRQNGITEIEMIEALKDRGMTLPEYKEQVRIEILKSKLTSTQIREGAAVRDIEIKKYIKEHPELTASGKKFKLRRIAVDAASRPPEAARKIAELVLQKFGDKIAFADLARLHSDGPEAREGGLIGVVAEKDLHPDVLSALTPLKEGEISAIVESPKQLDIFFVDKIFDSTQTTKDELEKEVREILRRQKIDSKMSSFFAEELYQRHAVEKKL
jgi:peptidyl-prolyl cis-trans isomerase SurA